MQERRGKFRRLGHVGRAYGFVAQDMGRVKNRLKSVLRSRGVGYGAGGSIYAKRHPRLEFFAFASP
ncbi:MAG TPA: hypothetical protein VLA09_04690 [Longimicrobiales bacterium]|nr:hypothetical protein [Longimicrobiales bacterium]